ncbi:MAG TPA: UvrB/UvrC motif-containing protein [Gemmataceae bacterium]|nr:UvrB/UvrC motif-containing protein [Gemmataceae bacterium]
MKCQACANPATVHITTIEKGGQKKIVHLCQACAEKQQLVKQQELNLPAILQTLIGQHVGPLSDELARRACPECGIKFMEFRQQGRLGCPHDYSVFRDEIEPLLEKIHRSARHVGKSPRRRPSDPAGQAEVLALRRRLREAVEAEAYEEAARIRDLLRQKEDPG